MRYIALASLGLATLQALTLKEAVNEVIETNPQVQERIKNYRAIQQDASIADSGYLPQLDYRGAIGHKITGHLTDPDTQNFDVYENSLVLTQNLFNGFGTLYQVNYEKTRAVAAAYNYVEKANDVALQMVISYIDVLRAQELYETSKENVANNTEIYAKVYDLFVAGLAARSEVDKIQSSLSLSRSNLTVKRNNLFDKVLTMRRVLGRRVLPAELEKPQFTAKLPSTYLRASMFAMKHNPSLMVSQFNLKGAQELYKQRRKNYYPTLDLELSQVYNDNLDSFTGQDDRFQAMLVLNYNLYRGGADSAEVQKNISKINQEVELQRDIRRQVVEGLDLSWTAYEMLKVQLDDLYKFQSFAYSTLTLYEDEYALGQRSLLDLLAAQNDFFNAQTQIINAEYDRLISKYRILDAMGVMVIAIAGNEVDYYDKVGLQQRDDDNTTEAELDEIPVYLDADNDKVPDSIDMCPNSEANATVMPNGCVDIIADLDGDGVKDDEDMCPFTPLGFEVDTKGCPINFVLDLTFDALSNKVDAKSRLQVQQFARFLEENPLYNA
ncbi:MAG TPA: hypothetical protein ENK65_03125, partial [Helicobacteraceae bacterium]|nr:hypothetical protein [Helicobacteraceae bacterium]